MAAAGGKKLGKLVKGMKKTVEKVIHPPFLKTYIPAGQATPAPPLGTQLGQVRNGCALEFIVNLGFGNANCGRRG